MLNKNVQQCGNFALLNTRSLTGKGTFLQDFISDNNCDMLMLTETWQASNDFVELNLLSPPGFSTLTKPRIGGRGGGLAVVYRQSLHIELSPFHEVTSFEYLAFKITSHSSLLIILVYRPPKTNMQFLSDLCELLTIASAQSKAMLLLGDFNIHVDTDTTHALEFMSVLDCFNLQQHIDFPTHVHGHTLDLVCSTGIDITAFKGSDIGISDHKLIEFSCDFYIPKPVAKSLIVYRAWKLVDPLSFSAALSDSPLSDCCSFSSAEDILNVYDEHWCQKYSHSLLR